MPNPLFENLKLELLHGGVAPVYVERALLELREHHADLTSDALAAGMSSDDAERTARAMLGSEQTIASVILAHPELLAWSHRWPKAALCLQLALVVATFPEAPVMFCVDHGPDIARWTMAVGVATLLVGSLLAYLNALIVV